MLCSSTQSSRKKLSSAQSKLLKILVALKLHGTISTDRVQCGQDLAKHSREHLLVAAVCHPFGILPSEFNLKMSICVDAQWLQHAGEAAGNINCVGVDLAQLFLNTIRQVTVEAVQDKERPFGQHGAWHVLPNAFYPFKRKLIVHPALLLRSNYNSFG